MLSVVLWLWGTGSGAPGKWDSVCTFDVEMVERMAAQVHANLRLPHEVVVVTDRPASAFSSQVRHVDLMEHFGDLRPMGGCWLRLKAFKPGMSAVLGRRVAWIDLDSVVAGDLTPLFRREDPVVLYRSDSVQGQPWNGSLILFSPDDPHNGRVWAEFDPATAHQVTRQAAEGKFRGTDQAWLAHVYGSGQPHWDWRDGVLYYGLHCGRTLPQHARLVTFPGRAKPTDHLVRLRSPWLADLWPEAGKMLDVRPWSANDRLDKPASQGQRRVFNALQARQEAKRAAIAAKQAR